MTVPKDLSESRERIYILDLPVDVVDMKSAVHRILEFVKSGTPHLVITADSSGLVTAQTDPYLKELYLTADLVTPDSAGVLWAAQKYGGFLPERVSGVDLVQALVEESVKTPIRIFFLGAEPGIAEAAMTNLKVRFPGCNIVGARHGYFKLDQDAEVAAEVAKFAPDVLFVAMGIPRQEKFIRATQDVIKAKVAMGVGGSFDVFSGKVKRAPVFMQKLKLEWLWRFILNPRKLPKVTLLPQFMILVKKHSSKAKLNRRHLP